MKKFLSLILIIVTVICLSACGAGNSSGGSSNGKYTGTVNGDKTEVVIKGDEATVTMVKAYKQPYGDNGEKLSHNIKTVITGKVVSKNDGVIEIDFTEGQATVTWTITGDGETRQLYIDTLKSISANYPEDQKQIMHDVADGKETTFTYEAKRAWQMLGVREDLKIKPKSGNTFEWINN